MIRGTGDDAFEVLTMGRMGVDLYPLTPGVALEEVGTFGRFLGGTAANVAVAAARHGRRSAIVSRVGDDPFGRFVHRALQELGVDDRFVSTVPGLPTPITFCEMQPPDHFPLWFYRWPKAPDMEIRTDELDLDAICTAGVFWSTLSGLSQEPSRSAQLAAWEARRRGPLTILDLDYRPLFWPDPGSASRAAGAALDWVDVVVGNLEEVRVATGETDPRRAGSALLERGVGLAIVKLGPGGVLGFDSDGVVEVAPLAVTVVNGLGAGDGFGGALCHGLLSGWPLDRTLRFANAAGAVVATRIECSTAMPTTAEVEAAMEGHDDVGP